MHGAWILLFVSLWLVVILLVVFVTGLIRRTGALEGRLLRERRHQQAGPRVGFPAPVVKGHEDLSATDEASRGRLVVFLYPASQATEAFSRELRRHLKDEPAAEEFDLVFVLDVQAARPDLSGLGVAASVIEDGQELVAAWDVPGGPFAVIIDRDAVVRVATFVRDAADLLNLARLLPRPVQITASATRA